MKTLLSPRDIASQDGSAFSASTYLISLRRKLGFVCLFVLYWSLIFRVLIPRVVQNRLKISHSNVDIWNFKAWHRSFSLQKQSEEKVNWLSSNRLRFCGCSDHLLTVRSCWYHSANRKGKILRRIHTVWASPQPDSDMSLLFTSHQLWIRQCGTKLTKIVVLKHRLLGLLGRGNKTMGIYSNSVFWSTNSHFCPFSNSYSTLFTSNRGRPSYHLVTVSGSKSGPPGDSQSYIPTPHVALFCRDKTYVSLQWTMLEYGEDISIRYFHSKRKG